MDLKEKIASNTWDSIDDFMRVMHEAKSGKYRENECNWYAYRRSEFQARNCECNSEKTGMQIIVKPSVMQIGDHKHRSAEIELTGEANGVWWNLSAYSLKPEDVSARLADVEVALVAAWNALMPN